MDIETILDEQVNPDDLKKFETIYSMQVERGEPSAKAAFEYAFCLIRSNQKNVRLGIKLLEELLVNPEADEAKRDYLYFVAIGYTKLHEYDTALKYVDTIIRVEPNNVQAQSLRELISKKMKRDALFGAAVIGGAAMVGGAVLVGAIAAIVRRAQPK